MDQMSPPTRNAGHEAGGHPGWDTSLTQDCMHVRITSFRSKPIHLHGTGMFLGNPKNPEEVQADAGRTWEIPHRQLSQDQD